MAYDITYFGASAGELVMELLPMKVVSERPVYHIRAEARTASVFSLFYSMNDVAESFMDATGLFSHKFSLKLDESLQQRDVLELYDQRKNSVHYWSKLDHKKKGKKLDQFEIETGPYVQDGLSAFYYLRTLPLVVGKQYSFEVVNNGKLRNVRITVVRKESLPTKIGEIPAIVVDLPKDERLLRSLVENMARRHHNPIALVREVERLQGLGYAPQAISKKIGVADSFVYQLLKLVRAGEERLLKAALTGKVPISVAIDTSNTDSPEAQRELLKVASSGRSATACRHCSHSPIRVAISAAACSGSASSNAASGTPPATSVTASARPGPPAPGA